MNYEQLRIAMNAYEKRVQLEEAYKEGRQRAIEEGIGKLAGFAPAFKTLLRTSKGKRLKNVVKLKNTFAANKKALDKADKVRRAVEASVGRRLTNKEMEALLRYMAERGIQTP
tara:strand:+ start:65 stop:403 length:339 start_codon:yes stop_codon:yes gene_type:complete